MSFIYVHTYNVVRDKNNNPPDYDRLDYTYYFFYHRTA